MSDAGGEHSPDAAVSFDATVAVDGASPEHPGPCVVAPRSGRATGHVRATRTTLRPALDEEIDLPEIFCGVLFERDGAPRAFRAVFGSYDPTEARLVAPSILLSARRMREAGEAEAYLDVIAEEGTRRFEGVLVVDGNDGTFVDGEDRQLGFTCDPTDDLSFSPRAPFPEPPSPGTALITKAPEDIVYAVDGLECDDAGGPLRMRREDRGPSCDFVHFRLTPASTQPVLGDGTYPAYFLSTNISAVFDLGGSEPGGATLDVSSENPYRGWVTFATGYASSHRIEFYCPLPE